MAFLAGSADLRRAKEAACFGVSVGGIEPKH